MVKVCLADQAWNAFEYGNTDLEDESREHGHRFLRRELCQDTRKDDLRCHQLISRVDFTGHSSLRIACSLERPVSLRATGDNKVRNEHCSLVS